MPKSRLFEHLPALCQQVRRIALSAGNLTLNYFDESGFDAAKTKDDGSPVTEADRRAEELIIKGLKKIDDSVPIVGEESAAAGKRPDLSQDDYFWLVDPLDGTKEFISGEGDYTVNIALIHKGVPVLGVVYAPYHGELYAGHGAGTAIRWLEDSDKEKLISCRPVPNAGLSVVCSRSHRNNDRLEAFLQNYKVQKTVPRGSSLKICIIAAGKADLYPRLGPTCEWDTAAAHAVLNSAGGKLTDLSGDDLRYGGPYPEDRDPDYLNPEFVASSQEIDLPDNFT